MTPRLLVYTWPYALVFWGVIFWAFAPEFRIIKRRQEPSSMPQDASSKRLIMIAQGLASVGAFAIAAGVPAGALAHRARWFWLGLIAIVAGSLLRRHCWRMLGTSFTGAVIVEQDQAVVDRGAYKYIRHPSYTAGAIMFLGIGLALANWISLAVILAGMSIAYAYRVRVEERALMAVLGDPYRRYMSRTKRFVPFLF